MCITVQQLSYNNKFLSSLPLFPYLPNGTTIKFNIVGNAVLRIFLSSSSGGVCLLLSFGIADIKRDHEDIVPSISNSSFDVAASAAAASAMDSAEEYNV